MKNQTVYNIEEGFFEKDDDHDKSANGNNLKRRWNDQHHEDRFYGKSVKSGMNFKTCEDDDDNEKGVYGKSLMSSLHLKPSEDSDDHEQRVYSKTWKPSEEGRLQQGHENQHEDQHELEAPRERLR